MKTTKLISALLMPAMFVACSDEVLEGVNLENNLQTDLVEDVTIAVGLNNGVESRGTFAEDATKGVFGKFYFEPQFYVDDPEDDGTETLPAGGTVGNLVKTTNSAIAGDVVGIALPSAAANGNVVTNYQFYIAGYQAEPAATPGAVATIHTLAADDPFYFEDETVAFGGTDAVKSGDMQASIEALSDEDYEGPAATKTNIQKAVFKSVSPIMKGDYVLYYPYQAIAEQGKIPATRIESIQIQGYDDLEKPTTDHVVGKNMFAYSKAPFTVAGADANKATAKDMSMGTAAYIFQFKVYTTAALAPTNEIKMITVSTADDAKAFGVKGYVTAGATNTFAADAATAVDLIGVRVNDMTIPTATAENYKTMAATAYLSTYAIPAQLSGKNIVVRLYDTEGNVAEVTKAAAGSNIKEGSTDYWKIDLTNVTFKPADRLVFDDTDLNAELASEAGTLILKNNITVSNATIPTGFTINGANYSLTLDGTSSIEGKVTLNTTVIAKNNLTIGDGTVGTANATDVTITTLNNEGTLTVMNNATLNATAISNGGVTITENEDEQFSTITVNAKTVADGDVAGKLIATTVTNNASAMSGSKYVKTTGKIVVNGDVANTTINNMGTLTWNADMASTVTVDNDATLAVAAGTLAGTITNDKAMTVATGVKANGATITNNGTVTTEEDAIFTLSGTTTFANNGTINDNGVFSGLSRLTNGTGAKVIRTVSALNNLNIALAEEKLTGIKITGEISQQDAASNQILTIETTKNLILAANLILSTTEESSISNIELAGGTLTGKVATDAIAVTANSGIGANSYITVNGNITVAADVELEAHASSYTICTDITGTYTGPIYVK